MVVIVFSQWHSRFTSPVIPLSYSRHSSPQHQQLPLCIGFVFKAERGCEMRGHDDNHQVFNLATDCVATTAWSDFFLRD